MITISIFNNEKDNVPSQRQLTWAECVDKYFSTFAQRTQKGGLAFSPVSYVPGSRRGVANVAQVFCAVFDVEHQGSFDQIKPRLDGYEYVCHSSFSHTVGHPRFRIIFPLKDPVPSVDWPSAWARLNHWAGSINDPSTKDASRIYFLPCHAAGAQGHFIVREEGRFLDLSELPQLPKEVLPATTPSPASRLHAEVTTLSPREGLERVVQRCAFMGYASSPGIQESMARPLWRAMVSNAARFEDSESWIEGASSRHPEYKPDITASEIKSARSFSGGPITCERIRQDGFSGCPPGGCRTASGNVTRAPAGLWMGETQTTPAPYADLGLPAPVLKFLAACYPEGVSYINEDFLAYESGRWRVIEERGEFRNRVARYLGPRVSEPAQIGDMVSICKDFVAKPAEKTEPNRSYVCLENGTLNTANGELEEHRPELWLRCKLPARWSPDARCVAWLAFLDQIFQPDPDAVEKKRFLQEWFGYCITPDPSQHKFVWLVGGGGNGKSVLLAVLTALLGHENVSHAHLERLDRAPVRAELENKLVNISSEMSSDATVADGYLKAIVSGDLIEAEKKFKPPYSFRPFVRIMGATNHLPKLRDLSEGFFRRAIILTFNRRFREEEQDRSLEAKLLAELDGILAWSLVGLHRLRERGRFLPPTSSIAAVNSYKMESDTVAMFADECLEATEQDGLRASAIYAAYSDWCEAYGHRAKSNVQFGKRLAELGFVQFRVAAGKCWRVREVRGNEFLNLFSEQEVIPDSPPIPMSVGSVGSGVLGGGEHALTQT